MSVISGIGCDLNPNTAFLSSLGMQEGSRGNTSLVIYIHPSSPHQLVKCLQCGLATKIARCSDIFAAWPWLLLPWAILDFFASYSSTSFAGKFPTAGSWKHKLCSKERLSQLRLFNSLPVILPVFTKRRTGQSVPEEEVRSKIQNCRWENHERIFLFHGLICINR